MYCFGFRKATLALYQYFGNMKIVANILKIGIATVWRWVRFGINQKKKSIPKEKIWKEALLQSLSKFISEFPHCTQKEMISFIHQTFNIRISNYLLAQALKTLNLTRKRLRYKGGTTKHSNISEKIESFVSNVNPSKNIVCIDEIGFDQRTLPVYGYCEKGKKVFIKPHPTSRCRYNMIMAIDETGKRYIKIYPHSINSLHFNEFIKGLPWPEGSTLIMDNVSFHKTQIVKETFDNSKYTIVYTPPYSPDYNPIENVFSVVKNSFRKLNVNFTGSYETLITQCVNGLSYSLFQNVFQRWKCLLKTDLKTK